MKNKSFYILGVLMLSFCSLFGQEEEATKLNTQPWMRNFMENLDVGGYYRFIYTDRIYENPYSGLGETRQIAVIDPTYYDPMLFLYVGGNPSPNSSFGAELRLDNYMFGASAQPTMVFGLFNALVLRGNFNTKKFGNYDIRFGGIEWENLTPLTFGTNTGYNRFSFFERRPWDPGTNVIQRPADYYHTGNITQDVRFGTNGFKGLLANIYELPLDMTAKIMYGNSQNFSGYGRAFNVAPRKVYGGKLEKAFEDKLGMVGVSTYNTVAFEDSIYSEENTKSVFRMAEVYTDLNIKDKLSVYAEIAGSSYLEPELESSENATALILDLETSKELTFIPISLRAYRFGKYFINLDSRVGNSTITPFAQQQFENNPGARLPNTARLTNPGDLVNNRVGGNLTLDFDIAGFKLTTSAEVSQDLERISETNIVTYTHRINGLEISRLVGFPNAGGDFGPNARMNTFFRGAYEVLEVSDTADDGGMSDKLSYVSFDIQGKYKTRIANRDLYFFTLNTISTVNNSLSLNNGFINARYHEFELYYQVWRDVSVALYHGLEKVTGNEFTDQEIQEDGSLAARNQTGRSWGVGLDYQMSNKTFLYLRHRWFNFNDESFVDENFSGNRFSAEFKIFF